MRCPKCTGLMVVQTFFDNFVNADAWKCLNCGKLVVRHENAVELESFTTFYQQQKCSNLKKKR